MFKNLKYKTSIILWGCLVLFCIYSNIGFLESIFWDNFFYIPIVLPFCYLSSLAIKNSNILDSISILMFASLFVGYFLYFVYSGIISKDYVEYRAYAESDFACLVSSAIIFILLLAFNFIIRKHGRS